MRIYTLPQIKRILPMGKTLCAASKRVVPRALLGQQGPAEAATSQEFCTVWCDDLPHHFEFESSEGRRLRRYVTSTINQTTAKA
jgi:hypothetical protein